MTDPASIAWPIVPLGELGQWGSGGTPRRGVDGYYKGSIPWLKIGDLTDGVVTTSEESISEAGLRNSAAKLVEPGTLLIAMYGSIGKLGIPAMQCATNQAIAFCVPDRRRVSTDFLFQALMALRSDLIAQGKGGTQSNISQTVLKAFGVPVPPLRVQERIVALARRTSETRNQTQGHLVSASRLLERFRQSVFASACSGRLTAGWRGDSSARAAPIRLDIPDGLPDSWTFRPVHEIFKIQNGRAFPSREYQVDEGVRLLRPGNLAPNGTVIWDQDRTASLPAKWAEAYPDFLLGSGELVMNLTAQSLKDEFLGRCCLKLDSEPALLNQRIARFINLEPSGDVRPFALLYFKSAFFRRFVDDLDSGTLIRHMHSRQLLDHHIPLPPLDEQREIVSRVARLLATSDSIAVSIARTEENLHRASSAILAETFRAESASGL